MVPTMADPSLLFVQFPQVVSDVTGSTILRFAVQGGS